MTRVTYSLSQSIISTHDISLKLYRTLIKLVHTAVYCITEGVVIALQSCWIVLRKLHTCSSAAHFSINGLINRTVKQNRFTTNGPNICAMYW